MIACGEGRYGLGGVVIEFVLWALGVGSIFFGSFRGDGRAGFSGVGRGRVCSGIVYIGVFSLCKGGIRLFFVCLWDCSEMFILRKFCFFYIIFVGFLFRMFEFNMSLIIEFVRGIRSEGFFLNRWRKEDRVCDLFYVRGEGSGVIVIYSGLFWVEA